MPCADAANNNNIICDTQSFGVAHWTVAEHISSSSAPTFFYSLMIPSSSRRLLALSGRHARSLPTATRCTPATINSHKSAVIAARHFHYSIARRRETDKPDGPASVPQSEKAQKAQLTGKPDVVPPPEQTNEIQQASNAMGVLQSEITRPVLDHKKTDEQTYHHSQQSSSSAGQTGFGGLNTSFTTGSSVLDALLTTVVGLSMGEYIFSLSSCSFPSE